MSIALFLRSKIFGRKDPDLLVNRQMEIRRFFKTGLTSNAKTPVVESLDLSAWKPGSRIHYSRM